MSNLTYNEKRFIKKLEKIYDSIYDRVDKIIKQDNPCQVQINIKTKPCVTCICTREYTNYDNKSGQLCCGGCKFLGPNGCNAIKPLTCRQWLCDISSKNSSNTNKKLTKARKLMWEWNFEVFRGDKKESINWALERSSPNWNEEKNLVRKLMKRFKVEPSKHLVFEY